MTYVISSTTKARKCDEVESAHSVQNRVPRRARVLWITSLVVSATCTLPYRDFVSSVPPRARRADRPSERASGSPSAERSHAGKGERNRDNSTAGTVRVLFRSRPLSLTKYIYRSSASLEAGKMNRFSPLFFFPLAFIFSLVLPPRGRGFARSVETLLSSLLRHLAAVVHVNAHDLAAVLPLARHEVEVRLIRLRSSTRRTVQALGAVIMIPAILSVVTRLDGRRVPGAGRARQTVGRPGTDHPVGPFDVIGAVYAGRAVAGQLSGSRQAGDRRRRRLLLRLERLEREVRVRARCIILPGVAGDQTLLKKGRAGRSVSRVR